MLQAGSPALREGRYKFIEPSERPAFAKLTQTELGNAKEPQLYDLAQSPGETDNLAAREPERAAAMAVRLAALRAAPIRAKR